MNVKTWRTLYIPADYQHQHQRLLAGFDQDTGWLWLRWIDLGALAPFSMPISAANELAKMLASHADKK